MKFETDWISQCDKCASSVINILNACNILKCHTCDVLGKYSWIKQFNNLGNGAMWNIHCQIMVIMNTIVLQSFYLLWIFKLVYTKLYIFSTRNKQIQWKMLYVSLEMQYVNARLENREIGFFNGNKCSLKLKSCP